MADFTSLSEPSLEEVGARQNPWPSMAGTKRACPLAEALSLWAPPHEGEARWSRHPAVFSAPPVFLPTPPAEQKRPSPSRGCARAAVDRQKKPSYAISAVRRLSVEGEDKRRRKWKGMGRSMAT